MHKTILLTGATDGIGLETAKLLVSQGHKVLLHGRSANKLKAVAETLTKLTADASIETYLADLSDLDAVKALAEEVTAKHDHLDVLINNAGIFKTRETVTKDGLDVRFVVNTIAPYLLTNALLPLLSKDARVVNLSSAAQAPVDLNALAGQQRLDDMAAYSQSKLALTIWSQHMASAHPEGPIFVAVNPGSLLASKMVEEGFGLAGSDLGIGADILARAALSDEFTNASGQYYDNDSKRFASPHADARNEVKKNELIHAIETMINLQTA